jgi:hypothetical protein
VWVGGIVDGMRLGSKDAERMGWGLFKVELGSVLGSADVKESPGNVKARSRWRFKTVCGDSGLSTTTASVRVEVVGSC